MTHYSRIFTENKMEERLDHRVTVNQVIDKLKDLGTEVRFKAYNKIRNYVTLLSPSKGEAHVFIEPDGFFIAPSVFPPEGKFVSTIESLVKLLS